MFTIQERIEAKQAEIDDAQGWVNDLREMNAGRVQIANATRYVDLLRKDLAKLMENNND